jgi:aminomethyltransferase
VGENQWWLALSDFDAGLWARGYSVACGLDVTVREPEIYPVQVQGPKSRDVMTALFGDEVAKIRYYWTMETDLDGIPVVISRTGWSAEIGFEIYLRDPSRGEELWDRIMEAGRPYRIRPIAPSQIRRIEAGIFRYGADMTTENNPFEIMGFERLVEDQSADYIGKEALMRIKAEGVSQKLVGFVLDSDEWVEGLPDVAPAYKDGEEIGRITVIVWSPRMQKNIGYVWVPIELASPGNRLEVRTLTGTAAGETVALPFFDPRKTVPSQRLSTE